jgi:hypothetical protein
VPLVGEPGVDALNHGIVVDVLGSGATGERKSGPLAIFIRGLIGTVLVPLVLKVLEIETPFLS